MQWVLTALWVLSIVAYYLFCPFPPWAARMGGIASLVLLVTYASGTVFHAVLVLVPGLRGAWAPRNVARAVFLAGGVAVYALHGRPDELGSLWLLYLLSGRLMPRRNSSTQSGTGPHAACDDGL